MIAEAKTKIELLGKALTTINDIDQLKESFRVVPGSNCDGTSNVIKNGDVIEIGGKSDADFIHEITHIGRSLASGGMKCNTVGLINPGNDKKEKRENEIEAYQTGFAYDKHSYPVEPVESSTKTLGEINHDTLKLIKNKDGKETYRDLY